LSFPFAEYQWETAEKVEGYILASIEVLQSIPLALSEVVVPGD
jgi:hypothetical protein